MRSFHGLYEAVLLLGGVQAFWRMNCAVVQRGRIDPLVSPGDIAAHSHTIVGGANIGINATYNSLLNSQCTSCEISADKSAYWSPTLYYSYPNGSFYEVPHDGAVAYYLGRGPLADTTIPFPKGLNILTGDKSARSYDDKTYTWGNATYPGRPIADRVSFACLKGVIPPERPYMWDTDCPYGMRAQIHFQSCWNGKDLYKADNSHVAYQSQIDNGICPPTHPIQIPHLFLETLYSVANVPDQGNGGRFVFSQGDPTGFGFHADFQNGWETAVLKQAVDSCLNVVNFGTIDECPILQAHQSTGFAYNCPERAPQIGEPVAGLIPKLPGCIVITDGPEAAPAASMNCAANVAQPKVTSTVDTVPLATARPSVGSSFGISSPHKYLGCFNDTAGRPIRTLNAAFATNYTAMTIEFCQSWCKGQGYRLSGVEYAQECHCDNYIIANAVGGSDRCTWNCGGTMTKGGPQQICGGLGHINIYNNTDPLFVANGSLENSAGGVAVELPLKAYPANYVGCLTDAYNGSGRALDGAQSSGTAMTTAQCAAFCSTGNSGNGYRYYGTEFGTQCFCGDAISGTNFVTNLTTTPTNTTCNMRCGGEGDVLCGGPNAISLYLNTAYVAPRIKSPIGKYVNKLCYTDLNQNGDGRTLQGAQFSSNSMTAEMCTEFCLGKRMKFAGLEYGSECYCDSQIRTAGGARQQTCSPSGLMLCAGDRKQYCGGPSLLTLYYSATL